MAGRDIEITIQATFSPTQLTVEVHPRNLTGGDISMCSFAASLILSNVLAIKVAVLHLRGRESPVDRLPYL